MGAAHVQSSPHRPQDRPKRPVPVRLRQEVQALLRWGGDTLSDCRDEHVSIAQWRRTSSEGKPGSMAVNYNDESWARVYDSVYRATRQPEHDFYVQPVAAWAEPVLEVACGTGMVLLDLIRAGADAHGFDISQPMLDMLKQKLPDERRDDLLRRVSRQDMADFSYPSQEFGTALIPSGSFLFLLTQAEQITCLANIRRHLRPGGTLVLNFPVPSYQHLANKAREPQAFVAVGDF